MKPLLSCKYHLTNNVPVTLNQQMKGSLRQGRYFLGVEQTWKNNTYFSAEYNLDGAWATFPLYAVPNSLLIHEEMSFCHSFSVIKNTNKFYIKQFLKCQNNPNDRSNIDGFLFHSWSTLKELHTEELRLSTGPTLQIYTPMNQEGRACPAYQRTHLNFLPINGTTQVFGKATSRLGCCCCTQRSPEIAVIQQLLSSMCQQASYMLKAAFKKSFSVQNNCIELRDQKNCYLFQNTWLGYFHINQPHINRCINRYKWIFINKAFEAQWSF